MSFVLQAQEFVDKVKDIAQNYNTTYGWGAFGFPVSQYNIDRLVDLYPKEYSSDKISELESMANDGSKYFIFDCVGLIKGVLWGWNGNFNKLNGGAIYLSNDVPDVDCNTMFNNYCTEQTSSFTENDVDCIEPGELLWNQGHIGIYIGNGLAVEATASWEDKVMITAVKNINEIDGYHSKEWNKHGKCVFIGYSSSVDTRCNNIYLSEGVAAKRTGPSTQYDINSRCIKGGYYPASDIVTNEGSTQKWFKHAGTDLYSALTDIDGSSLFSNFGQYHIGVTNAPVNIRKAASLSAEKYTTLDSKTTVYLTDKSPIKSDGYTWIQLVYDAKLCWCVNLWVDQNNLSDSDA